MAISKKQLQQLIKQGATIYFTPQNERVEKIYLTEENEPEIFKDSKGYYGLNVYFYKDDKDVYPIGELFETEEDALWELEMSVTRTETLKMPTWKEFNNQRQTIIFYKNQVKYQMYIFVKNKNTNNCRIIIYADDNSQEWFVFEKPLTKENYTEACKLCLKLFKGEKGNE